MISDIEGLKALVRDEVEARREELIELSLRIHAHPERAFKEAKASGWLGDYLEANGFQVERGVGKLATAFKASYGSGRPVLAILAEYDALPRLGHACGHNIIGVAAVGAGVAARRAVERLGGSVLVFGTPGEEAYGGKVFLVQRGLFSEVEVAMMIHPGTQDMVIDQALAAATLKVEFFGRAAHAAARPHQGINALAAMILAFNGIDSLRQHIRDRARIHGIITDGGQAPNIVPAHSAGTFLVRAEDEGYLDELREKVLNCFKAAALATGARLEYHWSPVQYAPLRTNQALAKVFACNLEALGRRIEPFSPDRGLGSTDMGNVSQVAPSIHPSVSIADREVSVHSPEFAAAAASEAGHRGLLDGAKALAMTVVDLLASPETLTRIQQEFLG